MEVIKKLLAWIKNISVNTLIDILVAIIIVIVFSILSSGISYLILKIFNKKKDKKYIKSTSLYLPLKASIVLLGVFVAVKILQLPKDVMTVIYKGFKMAMIVIVAKGLAEAFNPNSRILEKMQKSERYKENRTFANFISKIVKYTIYIITAFILIGEMGYDLSGLIAGLGIGGAVVALAAQDVAKNLFGGATIIIDKPFVVGDFIGTSKYEGTVEDVTFRSTRIRKNDNSVVIEPNSILANESIINWSRLQKRRYEFNLKLPLETKAEIIDRLISRIKFVLRSNKDIIQDSIEVHFNTVEEDAININVYLYTKITEYTAYLGLREKINLSLMELLETENITLTYPAQNIYLKNDVKDE